jgi:hypothetical protein
VHAHNGVVVTAAPFAGGFSGNHVQVHGIRSGGEGHAYTNSCGVPNEFVQGDPPGGETAQTFRKQIRESGKSRCVRGCGGGARRGEARVGSILQLGESKAGGRGSDSASLAALS